MTGLQTSLTPTAPLGHVACIDDSEDILRLVALALQQIGKLQTTTFSDARSALAAFSEEKPDLILLDVMMPEMDGLEALNSISSDAALAKIPVVFMTARVRPSEVSQYMTLGAAGVIPKPFDPITLSTTLRTIWLNWHCKSTGAEA
jgi:CheY-like chemotaxis protein